MGRSDDPFWKEVEDMNDGSMKCKFCGHLFANGTSISRIKWHLSGERGRGVGICGGVPKEVQEAAFLAMNGGNKRHKSIASSRNVNDYAISTCPQEQDNAVLVNLAGDAGRMQVGVQGMEQGDLMAQVTQLRKDNNQILTTINVTTQHYLNVEAENSILRAQTMELSHRLDSLNEILNYMNTSNGIFENDHLLYLNQPIMASPDLFQY